jgi:hypothetical protein
MGVNVAAFLDDARCCLVDTDISELLTASVITAYGTSETSVSVYRTLRCDM